MLKAASISKAQGTASTNAKSTVMGHSADPVGSFHSFVQIFESYINGPPKPVLPCLHSHLRKGKQLPILEKLSRDFKTSCTFPSSEVAIRQQRLYFI